MIKFFHQKHFKDCVQDIFFTNSKCLPKKILAIVHLFMAVKRNDNLQGCYFYI